MTIYRCKCGMGYYVNGAYTEDENICDECGEDMAVVSP